MEVIIKGKKPIDPRSRILAIEAAVKAICEDVGEDAADGVMVLMTAAVHIATTHSKKPVKDITLTMASALGDAIIAADGFFKLQEVPR